LDAPAESVPVTDIPGSFRPTVLPLVLQELSIGVQNWPPIGFQNWPPSFGQLWRIDQHVSRFGWRLFLRPGLISGCAARSGRPGWPQATAMRRMRPGWPRARRHARHGRDSPAQGLCCGGLLAWGL